MEDNTTSYQPSLTEVQEPTDSPSGKAQEQVRSTQNPPTETPDDDDNGKPTGDFPRQDELDRLADKMESAKAIWDKPMQTPGWTQSGRSGRSKSLERRHGAEVIRSEKAFREYQEAEGKFKRLSAIKAAWEEGEVYHNGQRRKDAPSRQRREAAEAEFAALFRQVLKPGDEVQLAGNPMNSVTVKRVNRKTITTESGSKWKYAELLPSGKHREEIRKLLEAPQSAGKAPNPESPTEDSLSSTVAERDAKNIQGITESETLPAQPSLTDTIDQVNAGYGEDKIQIIHVTGADKSPSIRKQQLEEAKTLGAKAYENGTISAPAKDPELLKFFEGRMPGQTPEGEASTVEILKAWSKAWHEANLATKPASLKGMLPNGQSHEDAPAPQTPTQSRPYNFDDHKEFISKLVQGTVTIQEIHDGFTRLLASKADFMQSLKTSHNAQQLKRLAYRLGDWNAKSQNKSDNAESVHRRLLHDFHLSDSFSYQMGQDYYEELSRQVLAQTEVDLERYNEKGKLAREAREKTLNNPETLPEFRVFIQEKGQDALSNEQFAAWDRVNTDLTRERRKESKHSSTIGQFKAEEIEDLELSLIEGHHSKKNIPLFIVQMGARVERTTFLELKNKAKMLGGWYSSFVKTQTGFQFYDQDTAERFISLTKGDVDRTDVLESRRARKEQTASERLHELATDMLTRADETIEASNSSLQNTARRADIQAGVRGRAYASQALARSIHSIAEALSNGEANYLDGIRHRTHVEALDTVLYLARWTRVRAIKQNESEGDFVFCKRPETEQGKSYSEDDVRYAEYPYPSLYKRHLDEAIEHCKGKSGQKQAAIRMEKRLRYEREEYVTFSEDHDIRQVTDLIARAKATGFDADYLDRSLEQFSRLRRANIFDIHELRAALREYIPHSSEARADDPVQIAERELIGKRLPGFFPTPASVVEAMLERADIEKGHRVLEPSCGKGDIVEAIKRAHPDAQLTAIELNRTLEDVLAAKGLDVTFGNFLDHQGEYDRILMNPPFDNGADIDHVRHAFELLTDDGRLIAIMSEGPFFRSDKKATAFREWLDKVGGVNKQLSENAFNGADAFRQTGVRTRIVTINK